MLKQCPLFALLAIAFCLLFAGCSRQLSAGQWQTTTTLKMPAMPEMSAHMLPQISHACLSEKQAQAPLKALAKRVNSAYINASCHPRFHALTSNRIGWTSQCQNPPSTVVGRLARQDASHYHARLKITAKMVTFVQQRSHRVGSCQSSHQSAQ